jgi:tRNA pseudouridine55 synthase
VGRRRKRADDTIGVLIIDKPKGLTSHDVVARVRRIFSTRRVGHAGTLDPMATGVLVVMLGEATKLAPYLTGEDKSYRAVVQLGAATDTLDAEGEILERMDLPSWCRDASVAHERVERALDEERARREQQPPCYSAIKVGGKTAHARMRAGERVELTPRQVAVRELCWKADAEQLSEGRLELSMTVRKGYYVRALARDLGSALGVPAHLSALRRNASGAFTLAEACQLDADLPKRLMSLTEAASLAMPMVALTSAGAARAQHGGSMRPEDFARPLTAAAHALWVDPDGLPIAIGSTASDGAAVLRGFAVRGSSSATPKAVSEHGKDGMGTENGP